MTIVTKSSGRKTISDEKMDAVVQEQFLAPDFDEMDRLNELSKQKPFKAEIVWRNVALFAALHFGAAIGFYQLIFIAKWQTVLWTILCWVLSGLGITAGAHRLWSHKSYKASFPVRVFLMICNTMALQNDVIEWARDHRCHHKWTDTDADPHNTLRGFFFSHMGWLLVKKHPQVKEQGAKLDLSDLTSDPVLMFQRKYYMPMIVLWCFLIPTYVATLWGESAFVGLYTAAIFRYCFTLHATWFINSAAHKWGTRPYDEQITSVESIWTSVFAIGEGGHNFHHTFPQDYRASEMPLHFNITLFVIDTFASLGLVYDRKFVADEVIQRQMAKHGFKGHHHH